MQDSYIRTTIQHLSETTTFIASECPHITKEWSKDYMAKLDTWYINLSNKLYHQVQGQAAIEPNPTKEHGITLSTIWDATNKEWEDLKAKVSN